MSIKPFPAEFLLVRPEAPNDPWEVWLDWDMSFDGDLSAPRSLVGWRRDDCLLVRAPQEKHPRHVGPFAASDWSEIERTGLMVVICGPSGVLLRDPVRLVPEDPSGPHGREMALPPGASCRKPV